MVKFYSYTNFVLLSLQNYWASTERTQFTNDVAEWTNIWTIGMNKSIIMLYVFPRILLHTAIYLVVFYIKPIWK